MYVRRCHGTAKSQQGPPARSAGSSRYLPHREHASGKSAKEPLSGRPSMRARTRRWRERARSDTLDLGPCSFGVMRFWLCLVASTVLMAGDAAASTVGHNPCGAWHQVLRHVAPTALASPAIATGRAGRCYPGKLDNPKRCDCVRVLAASLGATTGRSALGPSRRRKPSPVGTHQGSGWWNAAHRWVVRRGAAFC
jgi:hypothetical protein